ncbi:MULTISPECIES: hypothetical protein [unclassified Bacillus (in: firmicutes)]|uniref:hypothetical protein n=1 Tax=unclassified Bacillus (in: firmicutes) TaxID=185979 RepID=UPI0008F0E291|nr:MULTISPECIES: hypothetical protein [unclassified Bacillus (in: firmicutes)]SFH96541.1 hypothetical protein SAMN04488574_10170 [Bacillus sp. 71mf]SFS94652.1 hypothetical protein SAMN04488145_105220 [Bacillus sp. 103mf]
MISEIVIEKVYLAQWATDLRKSIDGLAAIVKGVWIILSNGFIYENNILTFKVRRMPDVNLMKP